MAIPLTKLIRKLEQDSPTQLAGSVKSLPLRDLLHNEHEMQELLEGRQNGLPSPSDDLTGLYKKLQDVIAKRLRVADKLIGKFSETSPEIIALNTSVFSLVPSRDVLEDVKMAHTLPESRNAQLHRASANILEAVNIEIQQRFYEASPEAIAMQYSGPSLGSYQQLLTNLLHHIEVGSDIFKVYSTILSNLNKGRWLYERYISVAHALCDEIFRSDPPVFLGVFPRYSIEELETSATAIRETLKILDLDVTGKPGIQDFATQCRRTLERLSSYFLMYKVHIRKSSRVLHIAHHIVTFLSTENVSENTTNTLLICLDVFEETSRFLTTQQRHLDTVLNLRSLDTAHQKVQNALRYRQFSLAHLLQDISFLAPDDLALIAGEYLDTNHILLQEVSDVLDSYLAAFQEAPRQEVIALKEQIQDNIEKVSTAMQMRPLATGKDTPQVTGDSSLHRLRPSHDKELLRLIYKSLNRGKKPEQSFDADNPEPVFPVSARQLQEFVDSFLRVLDNIQDSKKHSLYMA